MADTKLFYVADFRPEWSKNPCVTFWRPESAGYAYPLPWSGRYTRDEVIPGYHDKREGRRLIRFAVPCAVVDALGAMPPAGLIDDNSGPVVLNTADNRRALRNARLRLEVQ